MIVHTPRLAPRRQIGGFGFWAVLAQLGTQLLGSETSKAAPSVQPAQLAPPEASSSSAGLYIGLGIGAIAITGLAFSILRSPARPVAGYRRRR